MKRILPVILLKFSLLVCAYGQITIRIDATDTISEALPEHYGTNIYGGNDLKYVNNPGYINTLKDWNPRFLRLHAAGQNICDASHSWLDCDKQSWDTAKIKDILEEYIPYVTSGDSVVINIYDYPPWKKVKGTSDKAWLDADWYADWCAQLVGIVNVELGFGVKYWECMNEWDGKSYTGVEMAKHYDACYRAMKSVDPSIKMMGPVTSWVGSQISFFDSIKEPLDVYSAHIYGTGGESDVREIFSLTTKFADGIRYARKLCDDHGFPDTPIFIGEWNIYWTWNALGSENMKNKVGACFDALVLKDVIERSSVYNLLSLTVWEEAGGAYSKIRSSSGGFNPGGHIFNLFSEFGVGQVVKTVSNNEAAVQGFSVINNDSVLMVAVMNRAVDGVKKVELRTGNWWPEYSKQVTRYVVNSQGLTESDVTYESISTQAFSIDESNVHIYVLRKGEKITETEVKNFHKEELQLYPNPVEDRIYISYENPPAKLVNYAIQSMTGSVIQNGTLQNHSIDLSSLIRGMYLLSLENEGNLKHFKILKR